MSTRWTKLLAGLPLLVAAFPHQATAQAPRKIGAHALEQIRQLTAEKLSRSGADRKLDSQLIWALKAARGQNVTASVPSLPVQGVDVIPSAGVLVDIKASVNGGLTSAIVQSHGQVIHASVALGSVRARVPLAALPALAARPDVRFVRPGPHAKVDGHSLVVGLGGQFGTLPGLNRPRLSLSGRAGRKGTPAMPLWMPRFFDSLAFSISGSVTTQGDITHAANLARNLSHKDGTGVRIGVLSDSAEALSGLIASGDLPANTVVIQDITFGPGSSEGTAMMEIIHDLAPGAQMFFASAFNGAESFAENVRALRFLYGCDILVDDVSYSDEGAFQDTTIAQAINDVTSAGALYFSAAGNSGSMTSGTSGTWEGDFNDFEGTGLHDFGGLPFNVLTTPAADIVLQWSDPFGGSCNDYDLYVLDATGDNVLGASTGAQACTENPIEEIFNPFGFDRGDLILIVANAGVQRRALHLDTSGAQLLVATGGATRGHGAGANTVSVAAVYWNSARTGTRPFVGGASNPTEIFSSDGPRRIFFRPEGTSIKPGNYLFSTNGGTVLAKPDLAAADGVATRTRGFAPFFGTSAAAPHAAAIAALVKSARPSLTSQQIYSILTTTALDIRAPGVDQDSGHGLVMALPAITKALQ